MGRLASMLPRSPSDAVKPAPSSRQRPPDGSVSPHPGHDVARLWCLVDAQRPRPAVKHAKGQLLDVPGGSGTVGAVATASRSSAGHRPSRCRISDGDGLLESAASHWLSPCRLQCDASAK